MKFIFILLSVISLKVSAALEIVDIPMRDGTTIQTCTRYPDNKIFPGKRPAMMLIMGSGRYDSCKSLERDYSDELSSQGVILFTRQKRGLKRNLVDRTLTTDQKIYEQADFPILKSDTLEAFEFLQKNPLVDSAKIGLMGGSEGTVLATHIGLSHPKTREITLISSMIESFPNLFERQFYRLLPQILIAEFSKNKSDYLTKEELTDDFLTIHGLEKFDVIDANKDGLIGFDELSVQIRRVVQSSLKNNDDTFFLSDIGGGVTTNWIKSAFELEPLKPQVLKLKMPVYIHHGTLDTLTLVGPVYELQNQATKLGKNNFYFTFHEGLDHELNREVVVQALFDMMKRLNN